MAVGDSFDEHDLDSFLAWFERRCADGYQYSVPSAAQWRSAFSGKSDSIEAVAQIYGWFQGGLPEKRFTPVPRSRYAQNKLSDIGSRPENQTVTQLFDMESNVQEIVRDGERRLWVIGGYNRLRSDELSEMCVSERQLKPSLQSQLGRFTGLRLLRRSSERVAARKEQR
jgi:hypothetical protein